MSLSLICSVNAPTIRDFVFDGSLGLFSIADKYSFYYIQNLFLSSKECVNDFKKILVGNKMGHERVINKERAENFAKRNNLEYYETNSLTGEGVNDAFKALIKLILKDKTGEEIREEFDKSYPNESFLSKKCNSNSALSLKKSRSIITLFKYLNM